MGKRSGQDKWFGWILGVRWGDFYTLRKKLSCQQRGRPFVFGVEQMELLGTEGTFQGDLVLWEGLEIRSGKSDHGEAKLFLRYRISGVL